MSKAKTINHQGNRMSKLARAAITIHIALLGFTATAADSPAAITVKVQSEQLKLLPDNELGSLADGLQKIALALP